MRIVVTGATGNVGTSLLEALASDSAVDEIVGLARRAPSQRLPGAEFVSADVCTDDLVPLFRGADAVIHLAWLIQPGRDEGATSRVNIGGSHRVFEAVVRTKVPALIYASSVGAYSPGPKDRRVDESWPTEGIATSFYSRHKVAVERQLDRLADEQTSLRIVRLRPGLIFKREAATEIRRLFIGPLLPRAILRAALFPVSPAVPGLRFQAVHARDVADAYRRAVVSDASGAFNIAAEPPIGAEELATLLDARVVHVPAKLLRGVAAMTFTLRLQPTEPGWVDMALAVPLMDTARAAEQLGWRPTQDAPAVLRELFDGLRDNADGPTPTLAARTSGPARVREFLTGLGARL